MCDLLCSAGAGQEAVQETQGSESGEEKEEADRGSRDRPGHHHQTPSEEEEVRPAPSRPVPSRITHRALIVFLCVPQLQLQSQHHALGEEAEEADQAAGAHGAGEDRCGR